MTLRLQLIVAVAVIVALFYIGNLVRIRRLELKYALIWFLVGVLLLIFDLAPGILDFLTDLLGITLPINMLFFLGIAFIFDDHVFSDHRDLQSDPKDQTADPGDRNAQSAD